MKFLPEHYLETAGQRINDARILHNAARFSAAIYVTGVAVECMLLAYRTRIEPHFESRHDLKDLLKESGIAGFVRDNEQQQFAGYFGEVWSRWKNNYRYASDDRLRAQLKKLPGNWKVKGDVLKENSRVILDNGFQIVTLGAHRWH